MQDDDDSKQIQETAEDKPVAPVAPVAPATPIVPAAPAVVDDDVEIEEDAEEEEEEDEEETTQSGDGSGQDFMPFCNKCGTQIPENVKFCPSCGKPVAPVAPAAIPMATQSSSVFGQMLGLETAENLSLWDYFIKCWKNYANFEGRARRKEYWGFTLFCTLVSFGIMIVDIMISGDGILYALYYFAALIPILAVSWRRMHDIGKSGWNWLWALTIVGFLYLFVLCCTEGEAKENKYGPNPK